MKMSKHMTIKKNVDTRTFIEISQFWYISSMSSNKSEMAVRQFKLTNFWLQRSVGDQIMASCKRPIVGRNVGCVFYQLINGKYEPFSVILLHRSKLSIQHIMFCKISIVGVQYRVIFKDNNLRYITYKHKRNVDLAAWNYTYIHYLSVFLQTIKELLLNSDCNCLKHCGLKLTKTYSYTTHARHCIFCVKHFQVAWNNPIYPEENSVIVLQFSHENASMVSC